MVTYTSHVQSSSPLVPQQQHLSDFSANEITRYLEELHRQSKLICWYLRYARTRTRGAIQDVLVPCRARNIYASGNRNTAASNKDSGLSTLHVERFRTKGQASD